MGRKKLYHSDDDRMRAQRRWSLNYYNKNKDKINKIRMEKYYAQKELSEMSGSNNIQTFE